MKWTQEEEKYLVENYSNGIREEILNFYKTRSWDSIKIHAQKLGIKRNYDQRQSDLSILLEDTNETYYWIGFLLADGHISNRNELIITLSIKDKDQIEKFAKFIKCKNIRYITRKRDKIQFISIRVRDKINIPKFVEKFNWNHQKTYYPPNIQIENYDLFLSFLTGFIDGDGSIRKVNNCNSFHVFIMIHANWLQVLEKWRSILVNNYEINIPNIKIYNDKCRMIITNTILTKRIKNDILKLNLPYMERKWDIIDLNIENQNEIAIKRYNLVKDLYNKNLSCKDISDKLNLDYSCVRYIFDKVKKENNAH